MEDFLNEKVVSKIKKMENQRYLKALLFLVIITIFLVITTNMLLEIFKTDMLQLFILVTVSMFSIRFFVRLFEKLKNYIKLKFNLDNNEIYVREIKDEYSPTIISYLYNHKLEFKKDITAGILDLYGKKMIKLTNIGDNIKIEKTDKDISELSKEQEYLYNYITSDTSEKFNFVEWEKIAKEVYDNEKLSKQETFANAIIAFKLIGLLFIITFISYFIYALTTSGASLDTFETLINDGLATGEGIYRYVIYLLYLLIINIMPGIFIDLLITSINKPSQYVYYYTKKGCQKINKFNKFKKFVKDFTLIDEKEFQSVIIYESYLAYAMSLNVNKKYTNKILAKIDKNLVIDMQKLVNCTFEKFVENFD